MTTEEPKAPESGRWQFSLRELLLAAVVLAVIFTGWNRYRFWHAKTYPHLVAYEILRESVKKGDSTEKVRKLLGPGQVVTGEDASDPIRITQAYPRYHPDGFESDDIFVMYKYKTKYGSELIYLQFRNGSLVNHNPDDYVNVPTVGAVLSD